MVCGHRTMGGVHASELVNMTGGASAEAGAGDWLAAWMDMRGGGRVGGVGWSDTRREACFAQRQSSRPAEHLLP